MYLHTECPHGLGMKVPEPYLQLAVKSFEVPSLSSRLQYWRCFTYKYLREHYSINPFTYLDPAYTSANYLSECKISGRFNVDHLMSPSCIELSSLNRQF